MKQDLFVCITTNDSWNSAGLNSRTEPYLSVHGPQVVRNSDWRSTSLSNHLSIKSSELFSRLYLAHSAYFIPPAASGAVEGSWFYFLLSNQVSFIFLIGSYSHSLCDWRGKRLLSWSLHVHCLLSSKHFSHSHPLGYYHTLILSSIIGPQHVQFFFLF